MVALNEMRITPGISPISVLLNLLWIYLWWSMDGGWLDDRRYNHGDHHNRPAVDTGGIQHWRVHAAPLRPEGRVTCRLLWASRSRHGATWCSWQCPLVGPRRLVAGAPSPLHRDHFGYNHCWLAWAHVKLAGLALWPIGKMI